MSSYQHLPVAFDHGSGAWLTGTNGQRYLDALSGIAVCGLGHAHPVITQAIAHQAGQVVHTSNLYHIPLQEKLAERLTALAGMDRVFFCNSGAEANEAAIKITRLYARTRNIAMPEIIVAYKGFHGSTLATLSATGSDKVSAGFEPLVQGFVHIPYNRVDAIASAIKASGNIVAVMLEPVQGEGGIVVPDPGYLRAVRDLCNENHLLLILDEVQTGMCRTGHWFAFQHENITPDVMTLAKALGNGIPIGACLAHGAAAELIRPGKHGSTFGGNPLAARAALAVLDVLVEQKLEQRAAELGKIMLDGFRSGLDGVKGVVAVRGLGMMFGIELERDCAELVEMALSQHLLINVTSGNVVRILPPLIITDAEAAQIVDTVCRLIRDFLMRPLP
jgi:acetylornithine/N-succinyldiaminopimelate aminotransferase